MQHEVDKESDAKEVNLEGIQGGVDDDCMGEVKDKESNRNLEIDGNEEEKKGVRDYEEQYKNAGDALEGEVIGEVIDCGEDCNRDVGGVGKLMKIEENREFIYKSNKNLEIDKKLEEKERLKDNEERQKSAGGSLEGDKNKFSGEALHVEKKDAEEARDELETVDAKRAFFNVNDFGEDNNKYMEEVGVLMEIEEKKEFRDEKNNNLEINKQHETKEKLDSEEKQKSMGDCLEGEINKVFGESLHVEKKNAGEEAEDGLETIDVKETICKVNDFEEDNNSDVEDAGELTEIEEKKEFEQSQGIQVEKVVDDLKTGDEKLAGEHVVLGNNTVTETMEDIGVKSSIAISNLKDIGEKNNHGDVNDDTKDCKESDDDSYVKYVKKKGINEVKAHKFDNVVGILKANEDMNSVKEAMHDNLKREMEATNNQEKTIASEESKELETLEMEVAEDATANEKHEEKDDGRSVEDEEEDATKEDGINMEEDVGNIEKVIVDSEVLNSSKKKRGRGNAKRVKTKENNEAKEKREGEKIMNDLLSTPSSSSRERPMRERKIVERLVEVIEKEPNRTVVIEKGRGTPLKDIPNVAYKLARRKSADLKFLHSTLFGRKGKAVDFKNNLLQFSGFVWHEGEVNQRVKIKQKLDKCHKDTLLDLANFFDLNISKANTKKEEMILKLLDFMESPSATNEIRTAEEQLKKSRKRKRDVKPSSSRWSRSMSTEKSRKRSAKTKEMEDEDDEKEKDTENGIPDEIGLGLSESDVKETESLEADKESKTVGGDPAKQKREVKTTQKQRKSSIPLDREEVSNSKLSTQIAAKSPVKKPSSSISCEVQTDYASAKVFARKKRHVESPKSSKPRREVKDRSSGKKEKKVIVAGKRRTGPSKADLRNTICEILKEVDFNTATFTDILKMLATHYKMDLTPRKPSIKQMIQEELTKMADEAENEESGEEEDDDKGESSLPVGKKLKA